MNAGRNNFGLNVNAGKTSFISLIEGVKTLFNHKNMEEANKTVKKVFQFSRNSSIALVYLTHYPFSFIHILFVLISLFFFI